MKKKLILGLLVLLVLAGGTFSYQKYVSPTRIAMVNFEDFQVARVFSSVFVMKISTRAELVVPTPCRLRLK